jgi:hypothetical protein
MHDLTVKNKRGYFCYINCNTSINIDYIVSFPISLYKNRSTEVFFSITTKMHVKI